MPVPISPAPMTAARCGNAEVSIEDAGYTRRAVQECVLIRFLRRMRAVIPQLPPYNFGGNGPTIPQAVVLRDGKRGPEVLLLLRTSPRAWELPGGNLEPDEDPATGAVRETQEETGFHVGVERLVGWYRRTGFRPHISPVYACRVQGGAPQSNFESVRLAWFPVDDLPDGLFPWYRSVIHDAVAGVQHTEEQVQHLGWRMVMAAIEIHVRGVLGWYPDRWRTHDESATTGAAGDPHVR